MAKEYVDTYSLADAAAEDPRKERKTFMVTVIHASLITECGGLD